MKWVMGKYLTKPYQSFRVGVGLLTGYNTAHWLRNVPLMSYSSSYTTKPPTTSIIIMPAQRNTYQSIAASGSFVMRASLHNRDRFSSARDNLSRPYPSYEDVYLRSNTSNPGSDEFQDLGLNVRATLPYCSQCDSASYLARLVPLVTSGRLILDC